MKTKQTNMKRQNEIDLRWSSHIPLNTALLKSFSITGVLELGAGFHSTKLFHDMGIQYLSIEMDKKWIEKLNLPNVIHYECPDGIDKGTVRENIEVSELDKFSNFSFNNREIWANYLFIDTYSGYRLSSLVDLYKYFDVIVFHDFEPNQDKYYGYSKFKPRNDYLYFRESTWLSHSGFLFKQHMIKYFPQFMSEYERQCDLFADKFQVQHEVKVIKC